MSSSEDTLRPVIERPSRPCRGVEPVDPACSDRRPALWIEVRRFATVEGRPQQFGRLWCRSQRNDAVWCFEQEEFDREHLRVDLMNAINRRLDELTSVGAGLVECG